MKRTRSSSLSIFISGVAGSGKSSAVTSLGMTIASSILKDRGITTTAVLPVANNKPQVEIISKSVGELSEGLEGLDVKQLQDLLKTGVLDKVPASVDILNKLSTILIDEVTYIEALNSSEESDLKWISNMIKLYNDDKRLGDSKIPISLVIMGDPSQSGAYDVNHVGAVVDAKLSPRDTFNLPYMDFSFRSRNSFLGASIAAIQGVNTTQTVSTHSETAVVIPKGMKYGMSNGGFYGVNFFTSAANNTPLLRMRVNSAGQIVTPYQPTFMAYGNGNATVDPTNGTYLILFFEDVFILLQSKIFTIGIL